jgi:hypothetical protein
MKTLLHIFALALFTFQLNAQQITISGNITDDSGLPLPGVNVIEKGTPNGAQTDFDGNYQIQTSVGSTLVFSYVGFITIEKIINPKSKILNIQLIADAAVLNEVVVTGYSSRKMKSSVAYAVSVDRALIGKSAGIATSSHEPKAGQITAGEINDLKKWYEWKKSSQDVECMKAKRNWEFDLENKIEVLVTNAEGQPI